MRGYAKNINRSPSNYILVRFPVAEHQSSSLFFRRNEPAPNFSSKFRRVSNFDKKKTDFSRETVSTLNGFLFLNCFHFEIRTIGSHVEELLYKVQKVNHTCH